MLCFFLVNHHWSLFVLTVQDDCLEGVLYDGLHWRCRLRSTPSTRSCTDAGYLDPQLCLLAALAAANNGFMWSSCLCPPRGPSGAVTATDIIYYHQVMQHLDQLLAISERTGHFLFGRGPASTMQEQQLLATLRPLLFSKGVPEDKVEERMLSAVKRIGINDLYTAAQPPQPWSALKALASRPSLSFRWLKADELQ
ncbi:unnamed protein product [Effrenium voratum]|nr:unnamed protein product [Effrenium voratum]